jgi:hypothetical protein
MGEIGSGEINSRRDLLSPNGGEELSSGGTRNTEHSKEPVRAESEPCSANTRQEKESIKKNERQNRTSGCQHQVCCAEHRIWEKQIERNEQDRVLNGGA